MSKNMFVIEKSTIEGLNLSRWNSKENANLVLIDQIVSKVIIIADSFNDPHNPSPSPS